MREKIYKIDLKPMPWARAGVNFENRRFYDKQQNEKLAYGLILSRQHNNEPPFQGPTYLEVIFYMQISKEVKKRSDSIWHATVPDIDQLEKFLLDTMVQVNILTDDRIIAWVNKKKVYDKQPRVEIILRSL